MKFLFANDDKRIIPMDKIQSFEIEVAKWNDCISYKCDDQQWLPRLPRKGAVLLIRYSDGEYDEIKKVYTEDNNVDEAIEYLKKLMFTLVAWDDKNYFDEDCPHNWHIGASCEQIKDANSPCLTTKEKDLLKKIFKK